MGEDVWLATAPKWAAHHQVFHSLPSPSVSSRPFHWTNADFACLKTTIPSNSLDVAATQQKIGALAMCAAIPWQKSVLRKNIYVNLWFRKIQDPLIFSLDVNLRIDLSLGNKSQVEKSLLCLWSTRWIVFSHFQHNDVPWTRSLSRVWKMMTAWSKPKLPNTKRLWQQNDVDLHAKKKETWPRFRKWLHSVKLT